MQQTQSTQPRALSAPGHLSLQPQQGQGSPSLLSAPTGDPASWIRAPAARRILLTLVCSGKQQKAKPEHRAAFAPTQGCSSARSSFSQECCAQEPSLGVSEPKHGLQLHPRTSTKRSDSLDSWHCTSLDPRVLLHPTKGLWETKP